MQIALLHVPERLQDETMDAYRLRRRWSKRLAVQTRVVTPYPMQHRTDAVRAQRRRVVRAIGIRHYKRLVRAAAKDAA